MANGHEARLDGRGAHEELLGAAAPPAVSERGERRPDGRQKTIAYAAGCNPDVDAFDDWWELARAEFGGDDFGEFFDPKEGVFACILHSEDDLDVSATATHLSLQAVPSAPSGN